MSETPGRKRDREEDDEPQGFLARLFSTAKKPRRAPVESSTEATQHSQLNSLPRLNLSPPSATMNGSSPPIQQQEERTASVTFAAETVMDPPPVAAARASRLQTPAAAASRVPPSRTAQSPWAERPIQFHMGSLPVVPLRRSAWRPNSRTLVPRRRRPRNTNGQFNAALVERLLQKSQLSLQPDAAHMALRPTITTAPGRRQYGTNQTGSRLRAAAAPPPACARKKVSFDDSAAATTTTTTPRVPRSGSSSVQQRNATPFSRSSAASTTTPSPVVQEQDDSTAPLPRDFVAEPRPVHSTREPIVFENAEPFVDTRRGHGTLVARRLAPSTLGVTSVPPPSEPTRGYVRIEKKKKPKDNETVSH